MGNIADGVLNTFADGQIVSANDATFGLNPKMNVIRTAINDNDARINVLEGAVSGLGGTFYDVKDFGAVGDGIADDTAAIQAAINAAVTNKGTVTFTNGLYKITATLSVSGSCYFRATGTLDGVEVRQTVPTLPFFSVTSSYVIFSDLQFVYTAESIASATNKVIDIVGTSGARLSNISVTRCSFFGTSTNRVRTGISAQYVDTLFITDCSFTNCYRYAVNTASCTAVLLSENTFTSCSGDTNGSVYQDDTEATYTVSKNVTIDNNSFIGCRRCVYLNATVNTRISNNIVKSPVGGTFFTCLGAVPFIGGYLYVQDLIISKNSIDGNSGLLGFGNINSTIGLSVVSNYFNYLAGGIIMSESYGSIIGNIFNGATFGISLSAGAYTTTSLTISDNSFIDIYSASGTPALIGISTSNPGVVARIVISGNTSATTSQITAAVKNYYGINAGGAGTQSISISNNDFSAVTNTQLRPSTTANSYTFYTTDNLGYRTYTAIGGAAPTTGTWTVGTKVLVQTPTAGGYIGYVCTTAGTPGTWKGYGAIQV